MPKVLLFDIDGTLISSASAGKRALERSYERRFGCPDAFAEVPFAGHTDPVIMRGGLTAIGRGHEEVDLDGLIRDYLLILEEELRKNDAVVVFAGVEALLNELTGRDDVAVGLGTGNVEGGARLKLKQAGIWHHFGFGGYGSDHRDRAELLKIGHERGARSLHVRPEDCDTWVIGDTPLDIEAGRRIGARVLAVTTGSFDAERLAGADLVVASLQDPRTLQALLPRD